MSLIKNLFVNASEVAIKAANKGIDALESQKPVKVTKENKSKVSSDCKDEPVQHIKSTATVSVSEANAKIDPADVPKPFVVKNTNQIRYEKKLAAEKEQMLRKNAAKEAKAQRKAAEKLAKKQKKEEARARRSRRNKKLGIACAVLLGIGIAGNAISPDNDLTQGEKSSLPNNHVLSISNETDSGIKTSNSIPEVIAVSNEIGTTAAIDVTVAPSIDNSTPVEEKVESAEVVNPEIKTDVKAETTPVAVPVVDTLATVKDDVKPASNTKPATIPETKPEPLPKPVLKLPQKVKDSTYVFSYPSVPKSNGRVACILNNDIPSFSEADLSIDSYEKYGPLDSLGRCTSCIANIGPDLMPTGARGSITSIIPTGWVQGNYSEVENGLLYERCHLIAYQLTAENANRNNLITGTHSLNVYGMLPFENSVAEYIRTSGNHVLYRATPVFEGNNLVASGVHLEAMSVEDEGAGLMFNVFCYNEQPEIEINYATGENKLISNIGVAAGVLAPIIDAEPSVIPEETKPAEPVVENPTENVDKAPQTSTPTQSTPTTSTNPSTPKKTTVLPSISFKTTFVINRNSNIIHLYGCASERKMKEDNRIWCYDSSLEELMTSTIRPCDKCMHEYKTNYDNRKYDYLWK